LEDVPAYAEMVKRESEISKSLSEYRNKIGEFLEVVAGWQWNDPVSNIYRDLFKEQLIVDPEFEREELLAELKYKQEHRIPPGFKDANNEYSGVGDLLIWKTILSIGQNESKHLIFVSGDEKADWRYQSEGQALYPRFELLDEYRIASQGKSLLIISFAQLLEQLGAPAPVVAEVKQEEAVVSLSEDFNPRFRRRGEAEEAVIDWLMMQDSQLTVNVSRERFPQVIAHGTSGREAYEIKYISGLDVHRRIREFISRVSKFKDIELPITAVIVLDHNSTDDEALIRISRIFDLMKIPPIFSNLIVGFLDINGRFEPRVWLDLKTFSDVDAENH
jgi:hypothetical protein